MVGEILWKSLRPRGAQQRQDSCPPRSVSHSGREQSGAPRLCLISCLLVFGLILGGTLAWAGNMRRLVEFKSGTPVAIQKHIVKESGSTLMKLLRIVNVAVIMLPAGDMQKAIDYLQSHPEVERVHLDASIAAQRHASQEGRIDNRA